MRFAWSVFYACGRRRNRNALGKNAGQREVISEVQVESHLARRGRVQNEPDLNLNIWLVFIQGGFGTEIETLSSIFLVIEKVQNPWDSDSAIWPKNNPCR
jgi:hypothetical protein